MRWLIKQSNLDMASVMRFILEKLPGTTPHSQNIVNYMGYIVRLIPTTGHVVVEFQKGSGLTESEIIYYPSEDVSTEEELAAEVVDRIKKFVGYKESESSK